MSATEKFGLISKNRSFIKEKGFHHPDDFFRKTIANKGWMPAATMVVQEFYTNLAAHVFKKVQMCGVLVVFSVKLAMSFITLSRLIPKHMIGSRKPQTTPKFLGC